MGRDPHQLVRTPSGPVELSTADGDAAPRTGADLSEQASPGIGRSSLLSSPRTHRERWAAELLDRLTAAMSALGILFLLVVLGAQVVSPDAPLGVVLSVLGWVLWAIFALEFGARIVVAPSRARFLKHNWWQLLFLVLPFLRVLRLVRAVRVLRSGRVLSLAARGSRTARSLLGGRVGWLGVVWAITVLGSSQLLYEFSGYPTYAQSLHAAALATIVGQPLDRPDAFAQILEVLLAIFSVVVFATLAGTLGAYFLSRSPHPAGEETDARPVVARDALPDVRRPPTNGPDVQTGTSPQREPVLNGPDRDGRSLRE